MTDLFGNLVESPSGYNPTKRATMNGKPVHNVPAKTVINFGSAFEHKKLCDGLTFSTGSACAYSCSFCYVPDLMRKSPHAAGLSQPFEATVIRRKGAIEAMRTQLVDRFNHPKFKDESDQRVIYSSPLVDVAANMDLVEETAEACKVIFQLTHWHIRLLSKSNLLPKLVELLVKNGHEISTRKRIIFGVSTGTLDDGIAKAIEVGTPLVSKRIASLHWLQDNGYRTFGMICPSLPQDDYGQFARNMAEALRYDRCEHVWAEVINARGESFTRTKASLAKSGYNREAAAFAEVSSNPEAWERYARATFTAHAAVCPPEKLRFLQYVNAGNRDWWHARQAQGAVLL